MGARQSAMPANPPILAEAAPLRISVQMVSGQTIEVDLDPAETLTDLRMRVMDRLQLPWINCQFLLGTTTLTDRSAALSALGIENGSVLTLVLVSPSAPRRGLVKNLSGRYIAVEFTEQDTVEHIKQQILAREGLDSDGYSLMPAGSSWRTADS